MVFFRTKGGAGGQYDWSPPVLCDETSDTQPNTLRSNVQRADSSQTGSTGATATFTYTCDNGYSLNSAAAVTFSCTGDFLGVLTWKGTSPTCSAITCDETSDTQPNTLGSNVQRADASQTGSTGATTTFTYTCDNGYSLDSAAAVTFSCTRDSYGTSTWKGTPPTCSAVSCDETSNTQPNTLGSNVQRADSSQTGSTGATATFTYTCDNGYSLNSAAAVTFSCTGDSLGVSTWKGTPPTCLAITCDETSDTQPNTLGSNVQRPDASQTGSTGATATFTYTCNNGYSLDSAAAVTFSCTGDSYGTSTWKGTPPTCSAVTCDETSDTQPNTLGSNVQRADASQTGSTGATATFTYTCDNGYSLDSAAAVTFSCTGDSYGTSTWKGAPSTCSAVLCDETSDTQPNTLGSNVQRADSSQTGSTGATATFTYICDNRYSLDSAAAVTFSCTGDSLGVSTWKGTPPTCSGGLQTDGRAEKTVAVRCARRAARLKNQGHALRTSYLFHIALFCALTATVSCDETSDIQPNTLGSNVQRADSSQTGSTGATATFTYTYDNGYSLDSAAAVTFSCTGDSLGVSTWKGTSPTCSEKNECTLSTHNCDPAANYTNTVGSFVCNCTMGYFSTSGCHGVVGGDVSALPGMVRGGGVMEVCLRRLWQT
uniref:Sushi domain-containing protein n=1 Tax=Chromera velia CCMP2878 TaxID=1169474 RepID=A0A0G4HIT2_9ALVE|eukprot:Cvel_7007.t1-p1 / transcript=Cvel_7007.t1 / gene=Cvel_7007 / organism=Chromera_velia_CCMP2878 / gene_product=P-selectin, putative / transcript_product=P-selectin, putative / location=Cvel_scaffold356:74677-92766(+) / protein_length=653 / sequence_SO=supercontig / SO=protein_coding / is_pseudo=false